MRYYLFVLFLLLTVSSAQSQNLIPNGDFEEYTSLPIQWSQIERATGWINAGGTPDYSNELGFNVGFGIQPHSGLGQGGLFTYKKSSTESNIREYMGIRLAERLKKGNKYRLQFYTTNGLNSIQNLITTNNLGAYFSIEPIIQFGTSPILLTPQVECAEMVESFYDWTELSFVFTAQDTFKHITFGNFNDDSNTLVSHPTLESMAYYFFDRVELVEMNYSICLGESITLEHFSRDSIFTWAKADVPSVIISNQKTLTVSPEINTTYVLYTDGDTIEFPVIVDLPMVNALPLTEAFCFDKPILLNAQSTNATNYVWQDGSTNSTFLATEPGKYYVTLSNACSIRTDTVQVDTNCTTLLVMPNVFTPNSDGMNESFLPIKIQQVKNFTITIYNRWGKQLFQSNNPNEGWNGNQIHSACPDGTYFWVVNYESNFGIIDSKKGVVHLIR